MPAHSPAQLHEAGSWLIPHKKQAPLLRAEVALPGDNYQDRESTPLYRGLPPRFPTTPEMAVDARC